MSPEIPELGIALAAYEPNRDHFLEQLNSIQDQEFDRFICLITFDSELPNYLSDNSFDHISSDPRFLFYRNEVRLGHKKNFEFAAKKLCSDFPSIKFIAFSDQDDVWYPFKLKCSVNALKLLPEFSAVHTDMHILSEQRNGFKVLKEKDGSLISGWDFEGKRNFPVALTNFITCNHVAGAAMVIDKRIIEDFGTIPDSFEFHDHWYAMAAFIKGQLSSISDSTYLYRQHRNNVIGASARVSVFRIRGQNSLFEVFQVCEKMFLNFRDRAKEIVTLFPDRNRELNLRFFINYDLGFSLLTSFILSWVKGDTRTARPLFAASIGKFISVITGRRREKTSTK